MNTYKLTENRTGMTVIVDFGSDFVLVCEDDS